MSVRQSTEESNLSGLLEDLSDIFYHETQKAFNFFWPKYPYLSDEKIISTLSPLVRASSSKKHLKEVQEHFHSISLSSFMEIHCDYGVIIKTNRLYQLLMEYFPSCMTKDPSVSPETAALVDPMVKSVMTRYGANYGVPDAESKRKKIQHDFMELAELDTMKRIAELHLHQMGYPLHQEGREEILPVTLHVTIEKVKKIPKMDLLRGADVFCAIFLEGAPDLFQTEIRSGLSESDWTWDPLLSRDFKWVMAENSELLHKNRKIVIMVYDKDQISEDDLIGCVQVSLGELNDGVFDSWKRIIRPPNAPTREFLFFAPPVPELKLKITKTSPKSNFDSKSPNSKYEEGSDMGYDFEPSSHAQRPDAVFLPLFQSPELQIRS